MCATIWFARQDTTHGLFLLKTFVIVLLFSVLSAIAARVFVVPSLCLGCPAKHPSVSLSPDGLLSLMAIVSFNAALFYSPHHSIFSLGSKKIKKYFPTLSAQQK